MLVLTAGIGVSGAQSPKATDAKRSDPSAVGAADKSPVAQRRFDPFDEPNASGESRPGFKGHLADFVNDQKQIWTSPSRIRLSDATWLAPLGGITAGHLLTDRQYSASLNQNPAALQHYKTVSDVGLAGLIGAGASLYLFSYPMHNERWRETGFLAGEAALNSMVTAEAFKFSFQRERPYQGNGSGSFFQRGNSFPSEHAAAAWSIAGVIAHEYPGTMPKLLAYGMASAVSFSRINARQHFPSDVLVGSVLGYLISQNIYRRHHDVEIGGSAWESPHEFVREPELETPSFAGSPYMPLDSWIYPALERLAALGYIRTSILGLRPWTRLECLRLLGEAAERQPESDAPPEVLELYQSLSREFESENETAEFGNNPHAQIESVYARTIAISGKPLTDNEHFGQTILNDYGRPYQQGFNSIVGSSAWTSVGPFVIYARGEYQSAPSAPSMSPGALDFISGADGSNRRPLLASSAITVTDVSSCTAASSFAFTRILTSGYQIWMADQSGINAKQLSSGPGDFFPTCSPDGRWILYESEPPGEKYLSLIHI